MQKNIQALWLSRKISTPTMREITHCVTALIHSGEIPPGSLLPPVREFAEVLGVSPATVSAAWSVLRRHQMIKGGGRQGIIVTSRTSPTPLRFAEMSDSTQPIQIDLSYSAADPALLPDLSVALSRAVHVKDLNSHQRYPIIDALKEAVIPTWPYKAAAFMATNGSFEAIAFLLKTMVLPGSLIAVEDPTTISLLDMLEQFEVKVIAVGCDDEGPIPAELEHALAQNPVAFIYQPRIQTPSGHIVTKKRMAEMAALFNASPTLIIEQDISGDLSKHKSFSLGQYYPEQTVYIRSYLKDYGPDLYLAVLSATDKIIQQVHNSRGFSVGWSSRLLQQTLAWLLNDKKTQRQVAKARKIYADRYNALIDAIKQHGINLPYGEQLDLWLPVRSEEVAIAILKAEGITAIAGSYFSIKTQPHIRLSTSLLQAEQVNRVAYAIAKIIKAPPGYQVI